ncbi:MerR family transcriptional regulator [Nocardiopsis sp. Huas11]|uniref:MerR family transcriptional regulator n=1 Tax=Nocardiopsis sp. Huas11 TaxID=2183912 RepID=UPI0035167C1F
MIHELAARAGVTSRTLRHYDRVGLVTPTRVGANGYRYYGPDAVARLQRVLLMRRLGMGLSAIAQVLSDEVDQEQGLMDHVAELEAERDRIDRRIRAVRHTLEALRSGAEPQMDVMLNGFNDHFEEDVVERWGEDAFRAGNDWWHGKSLAEQRAWKKDQDALVAAWIDTHRSGVGPASERAQAMAARHVEWLSGIPGTPTAEGDRERSIAMVRGLGDLYVDDPAFRPTYDGLEGAVFVRDALHEYARTIM